MTVNLPLSYVETFKDSQNLQNKVCSLVRKVHHDLALPTDQALSLAISHTSPFPSDAATHWPYPHKPLHASTPLKMLLLVSQFPSHSLAAELTSALLFHEFKSPSWHFLMPPLPQTFLCALTFSSNHK